MLALTLVLALPSAIGLAVAHVPGRASGGPPAATTVTVTDSVTYRGKSASFWAARFFAVRRVAYQRKLYGHRLEVKLRVRWQPTVFYALRLASAVYGIPYSDLATVSHCESTWNPYATNGRQLGLFQLGWRPFGFSPFDPIANALSAAATVVHDGSWRQWVCKP